MLLVVARHATGSHLGGAGMVGVALFFVLSGFLITALLVEEHDTADRVAFGRFYVRRGLRLLPALYAMLTVVMAAAYLFDSGTAAAVAQSAGWAAVYMSGWVEFFGVPIWAPLGPTWSLAVEEQFYLLWPLLLVLQLHRGFSLQRCARVALFLAASSAVIRLASWVRWGPEIYKLPTTWADGLFLGCTLALLWKAGTLQRVRAGRCVPIACFVLLAYAVWPQAKYVLWGYTPGLVVVEIAGAILLLAALRGDSHWLTLSLTLPPLRWVGRRSYAIYLWNDVLILLVPHGLAWRLVAVAGTFAVSEVSWLLVEKPSQRIKDRLGRQRVLHSRRSPTFFCTRQRNN